MFDREQSCAAHLSLSVLVSVSLLMEHWLQLEFGSGSKVGRGGMQAKVEAATWAWRNGVGVVIANGSRPQVISEVMSGKRVGTFITDAESRSADVETIASSVRAGGRDLAVQPAQHRREIIEKLADLLVDRQDEIVAANKKDVQLAKANGTSPALVNRLVLTPTKLKGLADGLRQIAAGADTHLGRVVKRTKVGCGLVCGGLAPEQQEWSW